MIAINVSRTCADAVKRERLTSGMQGVEVSFFFSSDWDGLTKTAVFEGSGQNVDVLLVGVSCEIPPEVLKKYGGMLRVGIYGVSTDGTTVIPTVYADLGIIRRGADPQKDPTTNSSLPVWAQLQALIGDLSSLTTEDKTNLVAAINEAAKSGGGSGGGKDGTGIESITYKGEDKDGGNVYTVLLTDGTSYDITAPKGATGADGKDGASGKDGSPGKDGTDGTSVTVTSVTESAEDGGDNIVTFSDGKSVTVKNGSKGSTGAKGDEGAPGSPGADGVTPTIGDNGNWYIGSTDTGKPSRGVAGAPGAKGDKGDKGDTGATGAAGHTPEKGVDYWTAEDKTEIIRSVLDSLPDGTEVAY